MKGSIIIAKLGMDQTHCYVERDTFKIDPGYDYVIVRGTDENPKVVSPEREKAILAGRYPRLRIEGRELITDVEWTTGHHPFEADIEPRFSPERPKTYMVQ
jgi:hypothetical protein